LVPVEFRHAISAASEPARQVGGEILLFSKVVRFITDIRDKVLAYSPHPNPLNQRQSWRSWRSSALKDQMNPNKALWEKGDFTRIAATMRESGEALAQQFGIRQGMKILDLGSGDGTTALPAAKLGADVLGVDIASNLVEAGNRRAKEMGVANCRFQEERICQPNDVGC
jgi:2-polyprenyl-3-methyl-5-hydroxy-6-metoxy-1,4-benzoquinol methylase